MRTSIAISLLILAAAAFMGWGEHRKLDGLRNEHARLSTEAAGLGILTLDPNNPAAGLQITKRERTDKDSEARSAAQEIIALVKEMEVYEESGKSPDKEFQARIYGLIERMASLSADQIKILIDEFRAASGLEDDTRRGLISFAIRTLANEHPEAALHLLTESEDFLNGEAINNSVLSSALGKWAGRDPMAALEWVRENSKKHPELITDDVKVGLVEGAAETDLRSAFGLIGELGLKNPGNALQVIAASLESSGARTEFMSLVRDYEGKIPDKGNGSGTRQAMIELADGIGKDGFDAGARWISENKLTQGEIDDMASGIVKTAGNADKGRWIAWMGENLSGEKREEQISNSMKQWTEKDYRSAGEWLAAAPADQARNASVKGYVDAVAKYDPQTATQWALTLPEGNDRSSALQSVYQSMPKETAPEQQAREAFKSQHGIK